MSQGTFDLTLDPLASPLRRPRVARALAWTLGILLVFAAMMIGTPLSAPIVEETTKGIGIVLLFWLLRGEFDNVRDGFIYGALIGAGFNWFESALYVQQNFVEFGTAPYGFQIGTRFAWLGLARHAQVSSALINAQNELAFRKRRLKNRGFDPTHDDLLEQRRAQISALRQRLPG